MSKISPSAAINISTKSQQFKEELLDRLEIRPILEPILNVKKSDFSATARAHPMRAILKYHGMFNTDLRLAYFPSLSICCDAGSTTTNVSFAKSLQEDRLFVDGERVMGPAQERVKTVLDCIRQYLSFPRFAEVRTSNESILSKSGKGLGTSSSGGAALAAAAFEAIIGTSIYEYPEFLSIFARLLAGSAARSVTGGASIWFSYPAVDSNESYAVRLDRREQLADVSLIVIPIEPSIPFSTDVAHRYTPQSPLFESWALLRMHRIREASEAVLSGDWEKLGQLGESDSLHLFAVTLDSTKDKRLSIWEPINLEIQSIIHNMRQNKIPCYVFGNTGPTTTVMCHSDNLVVIKAELEKWFPELEMFSTKISGPAYSISEK